MEPKWAFITGASSGIGAEFARHLAKEHYSLVLLARRAERLQALKQEILTDNQSIQIELLSIDLCHPDALQEIKSFINDKKITIQLLINNAGSGYFEFFHKTPLHKKTQDIELNVMATTKILDFFIPHMLNHKKLSVICNIASLAGYIPVGNFAVYSATKAYLISLSETLATELKNTNIQVLSVSPGGVYTEFLEHANQRVDTRSSTGMMHPDILVKSTLRAINKKKRRFIPGFLNQCIVFTFKFLPTSFAVDLSYRVMNKKVLKIHE